MVWPGRHDLVNFQQIDSQSQSKTAASGRQERSALTRASLTPEISSEAPEVSPMGAWAAILLIFAAVYLGSAFSPALQDDADSSHAEAAREMMVSGDYVTLHINGVRYLEKAPLIYWLVAVSYRIFGVNEFATRLPTLLSMFLLVLLGFQWGRQAFGIRAGTYAALFVTTGAGFYLFTRILIPEALLSLLIAASFYFFVTALDDPAQVWRWYAGYACLALAVLTKGLIPLVFVGITAVAYVLISGDWRRWREFRIPSGLLLFFFIAAPWHILAGIRNPRFFWFYFVNEHFLRFLGKRYPVDYNKVPAALYWSLHLVWLFPWSLYLPLAIRNLPRDFRALRQSPSISFALRTRIICWIWGGVVLSFFAFSTSQEYYTFPAYFPLILLLASSTAEEEENPGKRPWLTAIAAITALLTLAAAIALCAGLWTSRNLPFVFDIGSVLAKHDMSEDTLSMSHMLDLTGESFAALRLPALLAVIAFVVGPLSSLYLRIRRKQYAATLAMVFTMGSFLVAAHIALNRFDPYLSSKVLADRIGPQLQPSDRLMIYGDQAFGSSLLFYLRRPIDLVNGRTTSMWFGSTYPDAPKIFLDDQGLLQAWNSSNRVFLFVPAYERQTVDSLIPSQKFVAAESSGKIIYSNRP
jgi:4-amino-4-deoxy-L-arabinose transferase-like glycosyltransferase